MTSFKKENSTKGRWAVRKRTFRTFNRKLQKVCFSACLRGAINSTGLDLHFDDKTMLFTRRIKKFWSCKSGRFFVTIRYVVYGRQGAIRFVPQRAATSTVSRRVLIRSACCETTLSSEAKADDRFALLHSRIAATWKVHQRAWFPQLMDFLRLCVG